VQIVIKATATVGDGTDWNWQEKAKVHAVASEPDRPMQTACGFS
jgi:hypothetical protein